MRYLGGKVRLAKEIAAKIVEYIPFGGTYVEPFCGGCAVAIKVREYRPDVAIICNDLHPYLIALLKGVADGTFEPPNTLNETTWRYIKDNKDKNPALTGFAGFCCCFAGAWFHGYARGGYVGGHIRNYAKENARALKDAPLKTMSFVCSSFDNLTIPPGAVVYCDPPYKTGSQYSGVPPFDYPAYMAWAKELAKTHLVFMSEYAENMEPGADIVWQKTYLGSLRTSDRKKRPVRTDVLIKL